MSDEEIFHEALARTDPAERAAYLDQACGGDPARRASLEALLRANVGATGFLNNPSPPGPTVEEPLPERPGTVIGPYKLLEQIGEGGFGVVFMAEQTQPVRRKVALKVLKPGMDTRQVVARFEAERQALAIMDHPNIAKVLDAGATRSGRPYFVMELVKGMPITDYCDQNHLTPRQRLELFLPVCQAVQHAHQKAIIHRDLKPSNILVVQHDTTPVPKVIDFGIAKALGQELTDKTLFTGFAQMVGTPLYMSPEQAGQSGLDIDTRSDIYSLGVLLYELLTGTTPFEKERFKKAAYDEIRRIIREEEPSKPSTKLSTAEGLPTLAANRGTEPAKLTKLVRGELDWIVMKTLEKDRNRRYETANGFAMDVQRYLANEAVQACPPSAGYRFRKFARRNKVALITIGLVVVALLTGTAVSTWQAVRATKAEQAARVNFERARAAVDRMLTRVAEERLINVPGMELVRKALLEDALQFYEQLLAERNTDPDVRLATAQAHLKLGWIHGRFSEANKQGAAYHRALELLESLVQEYPHEPRYRAALASGLHLQSHPTTWDKTRWTEAERLLLRAIDLQEGVVAASPDSARDAFDLANMLLLLGSAHKTGGQPAQAEADWRRSLAVSERVTASEPNHPAHLRCQIRALTYISHLHRGKDPAQAEALLRRAQALVARLLALPEADRAAVTDIAPQAIAGVDLALGHLYKEQGRPKDAERAYRRAVTFLEKYAADFPDMPFHRAQLGDALVALGQFLLADRRPAEAEAALGRAWQLGEELLRDRITTQKQGITAWHFFGLSGLGAALREQGRSREAVELYKRVAGLLDHLPADSPGLANGQRNLAQAYKSLADSLTDANTRGEAEQAYQQAIRLYGTLAAGPSGEPSDRHGLAYSYSGLGHRLRAANRLDDAEKAYRQAVDISLKLCEEVPKDINYRYGAACTCFALGDLLALSNRAEEAELRFHQALKFFQGVAADRPATPRYGTDVGRTFDRLAGLFLDRGKFKEAEEAARQSRAVFDKLGTDFPGARNHLAQALNTQAWQLIAMPDPGATDARRAVVLATEAVQLASGERAYWYTLGVAQYRAGGWKAGIAALERSMGLRKGGDSTDWFFLAMAHWRLGEKGKAREFYDRAVQWMDKNQPKNEELRRFRAEAAELLGVADRGRVEVAPLPRVKK